MIHKLGFCWCGTAHANLSDIEVPIVEHEGHVYGLTDNGLYDLGTTTDDLT